MPNPDILLKATCEDGSNDVFYKGEKVAINEMRKHIAWYTKNMPDSSAFRNVINHIENKEELIDAVKEYFSIYM